MNSIKGRTDGTHSNDDFECLTDSFYLQFKFYQNCITFWKRRHKTKAFRYKILRFDIKEKESVNTNESDLNEETTESIADSNLVQISVLNQTECKFKEQELFGHIFDANEFVLIRSKVKQLDKSGFRIDSYMTDDRINWKRMGFSNIPTFELKETVGSRTLSITGLLMQPIGQLTVKYLLITPLKSKGLNENMVKEWNSKSKSLDIGHRGAGNARRTDLKIDNVLENTIASFEYASLHGAEMVELDVQITKDKTPVIYHDFFVNLIAKKKNSDQMSEHSIPIHELTHQQLQWLKLSPIHKENVTKYEFDDSDKEDNQPFPSLTKVLEVVNKKCGFNIEVKFPQLKKDMSSESETPFEINEYVDIILEIIESYAKERTIMISSFHPDICSLIRVKQKRFPLLFLTMGTTNKYMHYLDPRTHTIETATYFALTGIDVHAEDIIRNRTLINFVKFNKLVLFCWGEDLNSAQLIDELKEEGVDGIIYDKIDVLTQKTSFIFDKTVPDSTNFKDLTSTSSKESILCLDSLSSNMS